MSGILNSEIEAGTLLQVEWMFFKGNSSAVFVLTWNENLSDNDILNRTLMFLKKCLQIYAYIKDQPLEDILELLSMESMLKQVAAPVEMPRRVVID